MPDLDWLNRTQAFTTAAGMPYWLPGKVSVHTAAFDEEYPASALPAEAIRDRRMAAVEYKGAHLLNDPYEIENRQVGALWARKSQSRCLFGQIALQQGGLGMAGQLDALLN
ncbi:MAG: hypothetical protein ABI642_17430 [Polaromonas sp.]